MNEHSNSSPTAKKLTLEVCLISARGLPRHKWLKHQYYATGWINDTDKYCTSIDASGNPNPVWNTKFSSTVTDAAAADDSRGDASLFLNVQVHSREPVFLREKLVGCAEISLREFLCKYRKSFEGRKGAVQEDVGSFQLREMKSCKPRGFIDVSVKVFEQTDAATTSSSFLGAEDGFNLQDNNRMNSTRMDPTALPFHVSENHHPSAAKPYDHPIPYPRNYWQPTTTTTATPGYAPTAGPSYAPPPPPPPPPPMPAYGGGYGPLYMNMPSSSSGAGRGVGPGFAVGMGVGGLAAAGAVMYGGDIMSAGFELPTVMPNPSLTIAMDPPF